MPVLMATSRNHLHRSPVKPAEFFDFQNGLLLVGVLATSSLATLGWIWIAGPHIGKTLLLVLQLWAIVCFCTLLIRVKDGFLTWRFGPGWIRGQVALSDIVTTHIVLSPLAYGWGFRRTLRGWRFHHMGALAIEIQCQGGRRLRLGTSRAHQLQLFIEGARGRRHRLS